MRHATPATHRQVQVLVRRGARDDRSPLVTHREPKPADGTLCLGCDAVFIRKTWRRRLLSPATYLAAPRDLCPACRQVFHHEAYGEVSIQGPLPADTRAAVLKRIRNVAVRAAFTQPERRLVAIEGGDGGFQVFTTSQKLAHRIAAELRKAFGGRVTYSWSDRGGRLLARWRPSDHGKPGGGP